MGTGGEGSMAHAHQPPHNAIHLSIYPQIRVNQCELQESDDGITSLPPQTMFNAVLVSLQPLGLD